METKVMLEKILKKGELDPAQQVEILSLLRAEHLSEDSIEKLFQRDFLSLDQKIELLGKLISEKAQKVICEEYLIASLGVKEKVDITLRASDSIDPNINIRNFLKGLWAQDIDVSSDFPWYDENYEGTTRIQFRV